MNAKPLDSCVSGLRITLIASATRFSAVSQPLISSAVTQTGKLPKNTVKLIRWLSSTPCGGLASKILRGINMLPHSPPAVNEKLRYTLRRGQT